MTNSKTAVGDEVVCPDCGHAAVDREGRCVIPVREANGEDVTEGLCGHKCIFPSPTPVDEAPEQPCPFCKAMPNPCGHYFEVVHAEDCFLAGGGYLRHIIIKSNARAWNTRVVSPAKQDHESKAARIVELFASIMFSSDPKVKIPSVGELTQTVQRILCGHDESGETKVETPLGERERGESQLTREDADAVEEKMRRLESDPLVGKHELRLFMQGPMLCGHATGNLLTCPDPPFGCLICGPANPAPTPTLFVIGECSKCGRLTATMKTRIGLLCAEDLKDNYPWVGFSERDLVDRVLPENSGPSATLPNASERAAEATDLPAGLEAGIERARIIVAECFFADGDPEALSQRIAAEIAAACTPTAQPAFAHTFEPNTHNPLKCAGEYGVLICGLPRSNMIHQPSAQLTEYVRGSDSLGCAPTQERKEQ